MREAILEILMSRDDYISGEKLSKDMGVSRSAIWKAIKKLKEDGYAIDSVRNKGYRLLEETKELKADGIRAHLKMSDYFSDVRVYQTLDSTNSEAKRLCSNNDMKQGVIVADDQTAGKGRRGRHWVTSKSEGIWVSLVVAPKIAPTKASMLTLVAAVAVVDAIRKVTGLEAYIKWPNDLIIDGKKICGILTEMSAQMDYINYVIVGIGINVNQISMPKEIASMATSLRRCQGEEINRMTLLVEMVQCFERIYKQFVEEEDFTFLMDVYNKRCINVGKQLIVEAYGNTFRGKGIGVDPHGQLIIEKENGESVIVNAGEVSVRGLYGYA